MKWFAVVLVAVAGPACGGGDDAQPVEPLPPVTDPVPYVNPFMGSGGFGYGHGSAFPGAAAPHGLAKVGPDTSGEYGTINFLHYSGYWYGDDTIRGFSHLHLHGTGATDYGVLAVMPTDAFDAGRTTDDGYASTFDKATEQATPGYYAVTLDRGDIGVEITATPHAAHHRYTMPVGAPAAHVIIDLAHHINGGTIDDAELEVDVVAQRVRGRLHHIGGMSGGFGGYDLWFEARVRQPWTGHVVWHDGGAPAAADSAAGVGVGLALAFEPPPAEPIELQLGLSLVSAEGAAANLAAEMPDAAFDATRAATEDAWRDRLSAVLVEGGTAAQRTMFYSSLYRAYLMPTDTGDADGSFRYAGQVEVADGWRFVTDLSLWDTYRTLHPLYVLLAPADARDAVISLHRMAALGGFFPKWPIATGEAGTMLGSSADVVIADAYVKGVTDFDAPGAYALLRAAAADPIAPSGGRGGRNDVEPYMQLGYVPAERNRSVSMTTEYAHDDFALGQLAAALGEDADAQLFGDRAHGYRLLYDPSVGFLRGRYTDGGFTPGFDALDFSEDFAEANAWQSLWMAQHDVDGLAELLGGHAALVVKLVELFERAAADLVEFPQADVQSNFAPRPYYWHGNEPDIQAAYMFAQAGRPDLAQQWVRWIMTELYTTGPEGLAGNDDGGTLSAWYVFSALGVYPIAGSDRYVIGAPIFTRARVRVPGGELVIEAPAASDDAYYVQAVTLDGAPVAGPELRHADLAAGSTLVFELGPAPGSWGR